MHRIGWSWNKANSTGNGDFERREIVYCDCGHNAARFKSLNTITFYRFSVLRRSTLLFNTVVGLLIWKPDILIKKLTVSCLYCILLQYSFYLLQINYSLRNFSKFRNPCCFNIYTHSYFFTNPHSTTLKNKIFAIRAVFGYNKKIKTG